MSRVNAQRVSNDAAPNVVKNVARNAVRIALGLALLSALPAFASDDEYPNDHYGYSGLGLGKSFSHVDDQRISTQLFPAGGIKNHDHQDLAFKVYGGYQFNRYMAIEGGYYHLGTFRFDSTNGPTNTSTMRGELEFEGVNLDFVGTYPFSTRWSLIGRVGAHYLETTDAFTPSGALVVANQNPTKKELSYKFGTGVQYEINPYIRLRLEGERYRVNDALNHGGNIDVVSLSMVIPFGRKMPEPVVAAPAYVPPPPPPPEPVVAAPPPPPSPPPPPPPPPRRRVSFSADSLFAFDKATISADGKVALDVFAKELRGTRYNFVTVEGHTDRLGSDTYNEKLSLQRAEAVKGYLADAGGIEITKLRTVGKGESMPVTKPGECVGEKRSPKLIACLQPDRRVEVEVEGTQAPK